MTIFFSKLGAYLQWLEAFEFLVILGWYLSLISIALIKNTMTKITWREKGLFHLTVFRSVHHEDPGVNSSRSQTWRWELKQRLWRSASASACLLTVMPRITSPGDTIHSSLHLPPTVVNEENGLQTCADMPDLWRHFLDEESVFPHDPYLVSNRHKN